MKIINHSKLAIAINFSLALTLPSLLPIDYATATSKIKVMSLGDSLCASNITAVRTQVARTNFGSKIEWVGTKNDGGYKQPKNECHGGWSAAQVLQKPGAKVRLPSWEKQPGNVRNWVKSTQPDIVLIMLGTNDFFAGKDRGDNTSKNLKQSLQGIINDIFVLRPHASIVIASIPPFKWEISQGLDTNKTKNIANKYLQQLTRQLSQKRKQILFVDMHSLILTRSRQSNLFRDDGLHFNDKGNQLIAQEWTNALEQVIEKNINGEQGIGNRDSL